MIRVDPSWPMKSETRPLDRVNPRVGFDNYAFSSSSSSTQPSPDQAFLGQLVQSNLWHHRLGHPTNFVVSLMLNKAHIHVPKISSPVMCHPCLAEKVSKLPFPQHHHKFTSPFATIHTDLWGPVPCISVDGYRYYTIFIDECIYFCWSFPLVNKSDLFSMFVAFYSFLVTQLILLKLYSLMGENIPAIV